MLDVLPECPDHGRCVPYALAWIRKAAEHISLDLSEIPRLTDEERALVDGAYAVVEAALAANSDGAPGR